MRFGPVTGCGSESGGLSRDNGGRFCTGVDLSKGRRTEQPLRVEGRKRFDVKDELPEQFIVSQHFSDCNCLLLDVTARDDGKAGGSGDPEFVSSDDSTER